MPHSLSSEELVAVAATAKAHLHSSLRVSGARVYISEDNCILVTIIKTRMRLKKEMEIMKYLCGHATKNGLKWKQDLQLCSWTPSMFKMKEV